MRLPNNWWVHRFGRICPRTVFETLRLSLRRPEVSDAKVMFESYANDELVTKYLSWPTHRRLDDTLAFIEFSDQEWANWQTGPLLVESKASGEIIGSTGLSLQTPYRASTGYVFAQAAWGLGYASEVLQGMLNLAQSLQLARVDALVHHQHQASARVLEKCGFALEGKMRRHTLFPNLDARTPQDVLLYAYVW